MGDSVRNAGLRVVFSHHSSSLLIVDGGTYKVQKSEQKSRGRETFNMEAGRNYATKKQHSIFRGARPLEVARGSSS